MQNYSIFFCWGLRPPYAQTFLIIAACAIAPEYLHLYIIPPQRIAIHSFTPTRAFISKSHE